LTKRQYCKNHGLPIGVTGGNGPGLNAKAQAA
jgi:hypothetical protein